MTEEVSKSYQPRDTKDADAAMDRLYARGFQSFRNGRILIPDNRDLTLEDQADFDIVKGVYRHSKLV